MSDKLEQKSFYSSEQESNELDLGKVLRYLLMQSKLIILIVSVVFALAYIDYSFSKKKYLIQSLLQYESFNQNIFDPSNSLQMAPNSIRSDVSNLAVLYESRSNFLKVIEDLKLNINIKNIDSDESIDITIATNENYQSKNSRLYFSFSENSFNLLDENFNELQKSEYGEQIHFEGLRILIKSSNLKKIRPIEIHYSPPESLYNTLKAQIEVDTNSSRNSFFTNEGLITISFISDDVNKGKDIVNYANNIFLNQRIYDETEKSRKAINFIDENIKSLEAVVTASKTKLKEFREKNNSIDISLEIEGILKKIESFDASLNSIDIEITKAQDLYTLNNPIYLNLLNKKKLIERQKESVFSEIEMMPKEQQEYIDLYKEVEISQALYEELESRRLGFSILEASTIGDIRVIDEAYINSITSPKIITIFIYSFISLIIACLIAIVRGFNFLPLSNPAEIFDNNIDIPIIGVIPESDDIKDKDDISLNTSIESLIVNINSIQDKQLDKKIITITSPSPSNGKSTVSFLLAQGISKLGKKVLLIDNDLKRGKLGKQFNLGSISEATFNSIEESTLKKYMQNDNLYVIPRVKGLNNTFQFLYSYSYKDKIKFFRNHFDFIIFDTGPVLSVADSSILINESDFSFLVVKHALNRINEIKQTAANFNQINKKIDGIIYNAYSRPKSYYGYYGLYGNYSYQYYAEKYLDNTYEYKEED